MLPCTQDTHLQMCAIPSGYSCSCVHVGMPLAGVPLGGPCRAAVDCAASGATCSYYTSVSSSTTCCMGSGESCTKGIDCCGSNFYCVSGACSSEDALPSPESASGDSTQGPGPAPTPSPATEACGIICKVLFWPDSFDDSFPPFHGGSRTGCFSARVHICGELMGPTCNVLPSRRMFNY